MLRPAYILLLSLFLTSLVSGANPKAYVCEAYCASKRWTKASAPPPTRDYAVTKVFWLEFFFPDTGVTVVRPISHPLGRADSPDFAYCFQSSAERYVDGGLQIGGGPVDPGPYLRVKFISAPDLLLSEQRLSELPDIVTEYSERLKSIEYAYLERLTKYKAEQGGAGEPATRAESDSEGSDKPQPESEGGSR